MTQKNTITTIIIAVILIGIAFYGGDRYGMNQAASARTAAFTGRTGSFGAGVGGRTGRAGAGGNFVAGQILSVDNGTMTVKLAAGGSAIVYLSGGTTIQKSVTGTTSDLVAGQYVTVMGSTNSDNSMTATSVQLRPAPVATSTPQQ